MKRKEKHIAVALQGGGAHGAFTWGVLDRLLEEEDLVLDGFSGTSAGAMNATVLAYGLHLGSRTIAKELLHKFWKMNSDFAKSSFLAPSWFDKTFGKGNMDNSPGYLMSEIMSIFTSPYGNPIQYNPLKDILLKIVDFDKLRACKATKLFVAATNVRKGRVRIFSLPEMTIDAVLASANLPFLFRAVTIDGEDYWDGGYMGNPPIFPLIDNTDAKDILLIQINPIEIPETPKTSHEIRDRINELSFNSSLMLELRKLDFVDRLLEKGLDIGEKFRTIYLHNINPEKDLHALNVSSKLNADWDYLMELKKLGRKYAEDWLDTNYDNIGIKSTCNIRESFF